MKASVFAATSLDGFIAGENGDIDWLAETAKDEEDYGFADFFGSVDVLVMGRNTKVSTKLPPDFEFAAKGDAVFAEASRFEQLEENLDESNSRLSKTRSSNFSIEDGQ